MKLSINEISEPLNIYVSTGVIARELVATQPA